MVILMRNKIKTFSRFKEKLFYNLLRYTTKYLQQITYIYIHIYIYQFILSIHLFTDFYKPTIVFRYTLHNAHSGTNSE